MLGTSLTFLGLDASVAKLAQVQNQINLPSKIGDALATL